VKNCIPVTVPLLLISSGCQPSMPFPNCAIVV